VIYLITISELDAVIYDDTKSYFHTVLGFASGFLTKKYMYEAIALTIIFLAYELWEFENIPEKRGDFIEFAIGVVAGLIVVNL